MEVWDREAFDTMGPAFIYFDGRGGTFRFICVEGDLDCEFGVKNGKPHVQWSWIGQDEMDPASGRGWAVITDDNTIEGRFFIHHGDSSDFTASRSAKDLRDSAPTTPLRRGRRRWCLCSTYENGYPMTRAKSNASSSGTTKADEIVALTDRISTEHLDTEYADLCRKMVHKLGRKRPSPLDHGPARTWAGGILYAVGWVNFLTDPSQKPHMTTKQLAEITGVGQSTLAAKFKAIRDALGLSPMDAEYSRKNMLRENPMAWMVTMNGLIMDARSLPQEVQAELQARGVIPP